MVEENKPQEPTPETDQTVATPAEGEKPNLHLDKETGEMVSKR
jgi:hypothetical protein